MNFESRSSLIRSSPHPVGDFYQNKASGEKISNFGNAKKVSKAHVAPVLAQNVCDSSSEKEICVRFAIAISAFRIGKVTKLLYNTIFVS